MAADTTALGDIAILAPRLMELATTHLARCLVNAIQRLAADYTGFLFSRFLDLFGHTLLVPRFGPPFYQAPILFQGPAAFKAKSGALYWPPSTRQYALGPSGAHRLR